MLNDPLMREKLEVLDGSRTKDRRRAAVRVEDMQALLQISSRLKSAKAGGSTPSAAEFDALVEDVHALHARLAEIAAAIQKKVLP